MISISIYLEEMSQPQNTVRLYFTSDDIPAFDQLQSDSTVNCFVVNQNIWDCAGDIALNDLLNSNAEKLSSGEKKMTMYLLQDQTVKPKFYTPEVLTMIFKKINPWIIRIKIKEETTMSERTKFHVEVPSLQEITSPKAKRDYAHEIDAEMVKLLDNKAVNSIFSNLVELLADSTYGTIIAGSVRISKSTYPEIDELVDECVKELGIEKPYVIISPAIQGLNAMAFGSDENPYVAISPLMAKTMSKERLKFIIGHECGHIAMGHMVYHTVISIATTFASAIPVIGPAIKKVGTLPLMAWSRRSEVSADRAGLLCCGDLETAERTLLQLQMPFLDAEKIDIRDYINNSDAYMKQGTVRKLGEFANAHPIIPKRIQALEEFFRSAKYCRAAGKTVPSNAIPDTEMESRIEEIIKVL